MMQVIRRRTTAAAVRRSLSSKSSSTIEAATAVSEGEVTQESEGVPIVKSLAAAFAAIGVVSATVAAVEFGTADSVPPYDPQGQRYDQSKFSGRFSRMLLACDPRLLLHSEDQVRRSEQLLENHYSYAGSKDMDRALWEARRIKEAALHPDTGDLIPRPFRMSGYVPFNGPVCVAMIASQSTMPLLFWSWVNQSQNALVNYFNRNASSPTTNETLIKSYGAAVGSALLVAFGLATFIQKRFDPIKAKQLLKWVSFPSAVVASSLNCYIMRRPEMDTGVVLMNDQGEDVFPGETSQEAAKRGVYSTTACRALLPAPVYFLPPALLATGFIKRYLAKNPAVTVPVTTFILLVAFGIGLPATVAVFPQLSKIDSTATEQKFQDLQDPKTGKPYESYYFNKGL